MPRRTARPAVLLLLAALLVGCGGGGGGADAGEGSSAAASPEPSASASDEAVGEDQVFFVRKDTAAINQVVARAQESGTTAQARDRLARCNQARDRGYAAWRACWHDLLDPYRRTLSAVAQQLGEIAAQDLPAACSEQLRAGERRFTGFERRVGGLVAGIDSEERAAQVRAMGAYDRELRAVGAGFAPVFQDLTKVCYSPQELASIDAESSGSPTASPQG